MKKANNAAAGSSSEVLKKLLIRLKDRRALAALSLIAAFVSVALSLVIPVLVGRGIDCIVGEGSVDFEKLTPYLVMIGICALISALANYLMGRVNNRITYHCVRRIRTEAFERIQHKPLSALDGRAIGDTVSRLITDTDQLADGLLLGFSQLFTGVLAILGTLAFMLSVSPIITLAVVLLSPLSIVVAGFISKRSYLSFKARTEARGENTALIDEFVGEQKLIRAFKYEAEARKRFSESNERLAVCSVKATFLSSLTNPSTRFANSIIYASVAVLGALSVIGTVGGGLTVGGLSAFLSYANQYTKPFNEISGVIAELQGALAGAQRLFELIEAPVETEPKEDELNPEDGSVRFDSVAFSYDKKSELIKDFSLDVKNGMRVAIVGPTGCGKTTLINLIMRFYEQDGGIIIFGGADTRRMKRSTLRSKIGMVLQQTWLKTSTVRDNIAMGDPDASFEEIVDAAKKAHAHGFIMRLENGYDTVVGDEGGALSEGQKQLICIARAMLAKPDVLILDEATSSIDTRTEMLVQDAMLSLMKGRTSFVVAHRLSTVRGADVILVMDSGRVIEKGSHDELISKGGFYKRLYETQFAHRDA